MTKTPDTVAGGFDFGEGPRWHEGRLWMSDFNGQCVHSFDLAGDARVEVELDDKPSGLGWLPDGDLLVVAMTSRQVRRVGSDGTISVHADLAAIAGGECNDMVVDALGRAWVGNFGYDLATAFGPGGSRPDADLALVRPDGSTEVAARGLGFPNGSVITPDGETLIVGESMAQRYTAFRITDDGTLDDRRIWAETPDILPDGCALDAEGAIWAADAGGSGCVRLAEGGEILARVTASQPVFACALGGDDRRTLCLITAPGFGEHVPPGQGRVEVLDVDVPGVGLP